MRSRRLADRASSIALIALVLLAYAGIGLGLGYVMRPESVRWTLQYPSPWYGYDDDCGPHIVGGPCDTWMGGPTN